MNFKSFLKTLVFLVMLFVVLYAGMNNTETITFSFPLLWVRPVHQAASLIFFFIFAIGVVAGTMLHGGGGGGSRGGKDK